MWTTALPNYVGWSLVVVPSSFPRRSLVLKRLQSSSSPLWSVVRRTAHKARRLDCVPSTCRRHMSKICRGILDGRALGGRRVCFRVFDRFCVFKNAFSKVRFQKIKFPLKGSVFIFLNLVSRFTGFISFHDYCTSISQAFYKVFYKIFHKHFTSISPFRSRFEVDDF